MVTMQDIADHVGVSRSTVSFALNGRKLKNGDIPEETRERIFAAARKLGYKRNELATSVRRGYSKTIAYIFGSAEYFYSLPMIVGASSKIQERGFYFKLLTLNRDLTLADALEQCVSQMVAGVICDNVQQNNLESLRKEFAPRGIPVVLADNNIPHDWCGSVTSDEVAGATLATGDLLQHGHRRIAMISYGLPGRPDEINQDPANVLRRRGFFETMSRNAVLFDPAWELRDFVSPEKKMYEIADFLRQVKPTAVFCITDHLAADVLRAATLLGLRVPQDLSVAGYGDLEISRFSNPALTSVSQPFEAIGMEAANQLLNHIESPSEHHWENIVLPVQLIRRASVTAPPPQP